MDDSVAKKEHSITAWVRLGQAAAIVVAAPFLVGAVLLWLRLGQLPPTAGHLARAQILGSALFASGVGLGIVGAAFALSARAPHQRILCTALTLFGLSHTLFAFYVRYAIEASSARSRPPVLPLVVPVTLWAYSVLLAFRAPKLAAAQKAKASSEEVSEEQLQPLSRP